MPQEAPVFSNYMKKTGKCSLIFLVVAIIISVIVFLLGFFESPNSSGQAIGSMIAYGFIMVWLIGILVYGLKKAAYQRANR